MLFVNYCIIKQFLMETYTKYITPVAAKICQHVQFVVPVFKIQLYR